MSHYAGYNEEEIEPVVHLMVDYLARPVIHEAFFKKYASKKFLKGMFYLTVLTREHQLIIIIASILARQWAKRNAALFGIKDLDLSLDQISS